ncbi:YlxR family protein [Trueperella sp. LYQ143]|uniref:YlxR family protein n=1 Tax=unclassified Trueperella TaxID=2630174 RepID=UPI0039838EE7
MPTHTDYRSPCRRTCIGCRQVGERRDLLRWVVIEQVVYPDHDACRPGRGAWVHPVPECVSRALHRKAFDWAFRSHVDTSHVYAWLANQQEDAERPRDESG